MTDVKKEKHTRTPRTYESIKAGALSLDLQDKVDLVKQLKESISAEVGKAQAMAKQATELVSGL